MEQEARRISDHRPKSFDYNINIPPRSSKSLICSVVFNAWVWGCLNPYLKFVCISHTESLSLTLAQKTKTLIESDWYQTLFSQIRIKEDISAKWHFENTFGGSRSSFGSQGSITGSGGDFIIIDDYSKAQDVGSIVLETAITTYKETITTRLNNPNQGVIFVIGQRLAENDLSGFLLSNNSTKIFNVCLPVELTDDVSPIELRSKYVDGLLWSSRFTHEVLLELQQPTNIGQSGYAGQYLQTPRATGGGTIKGIWFDIVDSPPDTVYHLFIDTAQSTKTTNDPSVILVAGLKDNIIYIKKVFVVRLEFPDLLRKIQEVVNEYGNGNSKVYIEPKSNGQSVISSLRRETMVSVIELPAPKDSKMKRVQSITPKLESRRVKIVKDYWNDNFLHEVQTFPLAKHDDQVDCLTYCVDTLLQGSGKIRWYV